MKYRRLTKEEQETLVEDFTLFLASNSIDKEEWDRIKNEDADKAEEMLDIFSDMIFEKALKSCKYLERISETEIHCYYFQEKQAHMISVRVVDNDTANFLEGNLSEVFMELLENKQLEILQGRKEYKEEREIEVFKVMQTGASFSDGQLYQSLIGAL